MKEKVVRLRDNPRVRLRLTACFLSPPLFSQQYSTRRLHFLGGTKVVCRLGHEIAAKMAIF